PGVDDRVFRLLLWRGESFGPLHIDDDQLLVIFRAAIRRVDRSRARNAIVLDAVDALKLLHARSESSVVRIAATQTEPLSKQGDPLTGCAGFERGPRRDRNLRQVAPT